MKNFLNTHKTLCQIVLYTLFIYFIYRLGVTIIRGVGETKTILCASWFAVLLFTIFRNTILTYCLGIPLVLITSIYAPVASKYGPPNYYLLGSLLGTDAGEIKDYLTVIHLSDFELSAKIIGFLSLVIFLKLIIQKIQPVWITESIKTKYQALIILTLFILMPPIQFFHNIYNAYKEQELVSNDIRNLNWHITSVSPKYDDYILIIGESVRRDYMHMYGYPILNTPFLDSISKDVLSNITASNFNTISALSQTLNLIDKNTRKFEYGKNIISLANSSGFETYWFSNQGRNGFHDTPISKIALEANYTKFLKNGTFADETIPDKKIIPYIKDEIITSSHITEKHRLFVIHLEGSHIDPCSRIVKYDKQYETEFEQYKQIACYISSIKQTDELLGEIYTIFQNNLKNSGRSFSILYISDHALTYDSEKKSFTYYKDHIKQYQIPYIKISSDATTNNIYDTPKSAIYFFEEFAHWIGVKSELFKDMTLFSDEIFEDKYIEDITKNNKNIDQAIDVSEYLK